MYGTQVHTERKKSGPKSRGLTAVVHVNITPELKAWVEAQHYDQSAFVRHLIESAKARKEGRELPPWAFLG